MKTLLDSREVNNYGPVLLNLVKYGTSVGVRCLVLAVGCFR